MALSVLTKTTTTIPAEIDNSILIGAQSGVRRGLQVQLLTSGFLWVWLFSGSPPNATKGNGVRVGKGAAVDLTLAFKATGEALPQFFDSVVFCYFEPSGVDPSTGQSPTEAQVRVLAMQ